MVTVTETSQRELKTSDDIAAYLQQGYQQMVEDGPFVPGELVNIATRAGMAPEIGAGDVAIFLVAVSGTPWSNVMLLTSGGLRIVIQVPTGNLAKREQAAGDAQ